MQSLGQKVWIDEAEMKAGDFIKEKIPQSQVEQNEHIQRNTDNNIKKSLNEIPKCPKCGADMLKKNVKKEDLDFAIKIAQLEEFISNLKDGFNTVIGRDGIKLSGVQKQRLSIARMVLQNPNIVILDESTSALDVYTESKLFSGLKEYLKDKTTIIIAHRLSTIINADKIYVLDQGILAQ